MLTMEVAVIIMGYGGTPTAALLVDVEGFNVIDIHRRSMRSGKKIDWLNAGKCPILTAEPRLAERVRITLHACFHEKRQGGMPN